MEAVVVGKVDVILAGAETGGGDLSGSIKYSREALEDRCGVGVSSSDESAL